ncbi:MAG: 23S rRNA (cytidine(2498)-2'-O)-methyltransferase RlmM [Polyangiaceae bacterium]|nr:23S rRNA (cytidine(2498)-2'-O)-methyltransferase RlmM [Polyangiaceae bacterium]
MAETLPEDTLRRNFACFGGGWEHHPPVAPVVRGRPLGGEWFFTTRPGAETDLVEELSIALAPHRARVCGPSCVRSQGAPTMPGGTVDLTFARQGFRLVQELAGEDQQLVARLTAAVGSVPALRRDPRGPWTLMVWAPDAEATSRLAGAAAAIETAVLQGIEAQDPSLALRHRPWQRAGALGAILVQAVLVARDRIVLGEVSAERALSLAPGGRFRMRVRRSRPSRSARKLEEALAWFGVEPSPGELCVDLGAAPGGWSWALLERRARVIAVDPGRLRRDLMEHRGVEYLSQSAFRFTPSTPADWLFCDMAWRPHEVAELLAKWGRRRWASLLVANLKLPMRRKAANVEELRGIVATGGWRDVRSRQLYHDRDEVTVTAHR